MASYEIRLTNLNWSAKEEDIKSFVQTFAKVKEVKLVKDFKQRSKGLAYLKLEDEQSLEAALQDVERVHMDRIIKIVKAIPLSEKPLKEQKPKTQKQEGVKKEQTSQPKQQNIRKKSGDNNETPASRGRGGRGRGVTGRGRGGPRTNEVDQRDNSATTGNRGRGGRGGARGGARQQFGQQRERFNDDFSIYVGNLSWNTTEMNLGRNFENYGDIKNVKIIEDQDGRSKGFGYVEFEKKESALAALAADQSELNGRNLKVKPVQKRESKPKTENN